MCGILGIARQDGNLPDQKHWKSALKTLAHRGPDGEGVYNSRQCLLGHQRLAIFDTSSQGIQPMTRGMLTIVFNGAIYNFIELRKELTTLGYSFSSQSDTEVIIYAYQAWGKTCVKRFNGMWAFVIFDEDKNLLFGSRDRFGIKPFYIVKNENGLAFASEIKALRALLDISTLNYNRVWEYLAFGWQDHTQETLFKSVNQLPAAHNFEYSIDNNQYIETPYYQLPGTFLKEQDISLEEAIDGVYQRLNYSVQLRTRSDVPWAITLSGGLDSSSIAGLLSNQVMDKQAIHAFSAIYKDPAISEEKYVHAVIKKHQLKLHTQQPGWSFFLEHLDQVLWHQDEPIPSSAVVGYLALIKAIHKEGFKVILNGQGADEVLAGYDKFFMPYLREIYKQAPLSTALSFLYIFYRRQFSLQNALVRTFKYGEKKEKELPWMLAFRNEKSQLFQRLKDENVMSCSRHFIQGIGLPVLLHYEDRNAMSYGIETRVPFLDHELVDFVMQLPASYKIRKGQRKYLLRQAMKNVLPPLVKNRYKKLGFATPQQKWMDEHTDFFINLLEISQARHPDLLSPATVSWGKAVFVNRQYTEYKNLWRVAVFGRWSEVAI